MLLSARCAQQAQNPNTTPNYGFSDGTSILSGEWKLIFTSALDVLSLGLLPGIDVGQVFQNISEDGTEVNLLCLYDTILEHQDGIALRWK